MQKSAEQIIRSLKNRAQPASKLISIRLGVRKHVLPFEVRVLKSNDYVFVHIPPTAALMKITKKGLETVGSATEAQAAQQSFRQSRKRTKRTTSRAGTGVQVPQNVLDALKKIPSGYKLSYDGKGNVRVFKARRRTTTRTSAKK